MAVHPGRYHSSQQQAADGGPACHAKVGHKMIKRCCHITRWADTLRSTTATRSDVNCHDSSGDTECWFLNRSGLRAKFLINRN